jgi:hypothetical protein
VTPAQALLAIARVALRDAYADGHWGERAWGVAACCGVSVHEAAAVLSRHCQPAPSGRERTRLLRLAKEAQRLAASRLVLAEERAVSAWMRGAYDGKDA